jgi:hypothetical protein
MLLNGIVYPFVIGAYPDRWVNDGLHVDVEGVAARHYIVIRIPIHVHGLIPILILASGLISRLGK